MVDGESPERLGGLGKRIRSHLALYVHCHRVRELEGVEESVSDDGCPRVSPGNLHELADHFGAEDAAMFIAQLDRLRILCIRRAGLHSHVKLTCTKRSSSLVIGQYHLEDGVGGRMC